MRIKTIFFRDPVRIPEKRLYSKAFSSDSFLLDLIDYQAFIIRDKETREVLHICPFLNAIGCIPEHEEPLTLLSEVTDDIEPSEFPDPINELPPKVHYGRGRPKKVDGSDQGTTT